MKTERLIMAAFVGCILLLAGCGSGDDAQSHPESVEERAQARWDHLIATEFEQAWEYYSPGYRQMTPQPDFVSHMQARPLRFVDAQALGAECSDDRCQVTVSVGYRAPNAPTGINEMKMTREIEETWIQTNGEWWYSGP